MIDYDINQLEEGEELNPSSYNPEDYPPKEELLSFILRNMDKDPVIPDLKALSVNGRIVRDEMEKYLSNPAFSSSNLKKALISPRSFFYDIENIFKEKKKKSFELGTFCHQAFAEPDLFKKVQKEPQISQSSKDGVQRMINFYKEVLNLRNKPVNMDIQDMKFLRDQLKEKCTEKGIQFISEEMFDIIKVIEQNYHWYGGGVIKHILKGAIPEASFYGKDPDTGIDVRVRPDFFNIEENIGFNAIISIKTTSADNLGKFSYDCAKYKYELSEGMYQNVISDITGRKFNVTIMIMLQTVPPYDVAVLYWQPEDLENGKYKYKYALSIVKDCMDKGMYPGFDAMAEDGAYGIIDFFLPEWSKKILHPVAIGY